MHTPHALAARLMLASCALLELLACAAAPAAPTTAPHGAEPIPELSQPASMGMAKCVPPQGGRTWVGFSEQFELADFGEAAAMAEALIARVKATACTPQPEADPRGVLAASLSAHAMWIAQVIFTTATLERAEVSVERVGGTGGALVLDFALEPAKATAAPETPPTWRFASIAQR